MRALAHRMVDDMLDYTRTVRERPPWQHAPADVKAYFEGSLPVDPQAPEEIYQDFLEYILPYPIGNIHPRFWGWVFGTGTVLGALADLLAASMNTNSGDMSYHSALYVEHQVLNWLKEMLGYPASASGLLTSGCSAANLIGLTVARNSRAGFDLRQQGLRGCSPPDDVVRFPGDPQLHPENGRVARLGEPGAAPVAGRRAISHGRPRAGGCHCP